ncbi:hypothetical protein MXD81_21200, partial [Microbacteriaceae bacterium K1510]|nr:hypothetical protein [Microbacteriaceae bacterium K1510]
LPFWIVNGDKLPILLRHCEQRDCHAFRKQLLLLMKLLIIWMAQSPAEKPAALFRLLDLWDDTKQRIDGIQDAEADG